MEKNNINNPDYWNHYWDLTKKDNMSGLTVPSVGNKFIDWALPNSPHLGILEIACGLGTVADYCAKKGHTVLATDFSKNAIKICKQKYFKNDKLTFRVESLEESLAIKHKCDVVIALEILEHYTDPSAPLYKIFKRLLPGGRLIFSVPDGTGKNAYAPYHYSHLTYEKMIHLLFIFFKDVRFYRGEFYKTGIWGVAKK